MHNQTIQEGKTIAIISHVTIVGTIAALIMQYGRKNSFAAFHIRQMVGLGIFGLVNQYYITDLLGKNTGILIALTLFIFRIIGLVGAIRGEEKKIPFLGDQFQEWFKNI